MNKFQRHFKSLPETEASFQSPAPVGVTVVTHGDGWVRGVTRMPYPNVQQISRKDLSDLKGANIKHLSITLD